MSKDEDHFLSEESIDAIQDLWGRGQTLLLRGPELSLYDLVAVPGISAEANRHSGVDSESCTRQSLEDLQRAPAL